MQELDFFKLSRTIQDRFVDSSRGVGAPSFILAKPFANRGASAWLFGSVGLALACLGMAFIGFGSLKSSMAIAPPGMGVAFAVLLGASAVCLARSVALSREPEVLPYTAATYLFPVGVVDARQQTFRVFKVDELESAESDASGTGLTVKFASGQAFSFPTQSREQAEQAKTLVLESQSRFKQAMEELNRRELAMLDPLTETGFSAPFSPHAPLRAPVQRWQWLGLPLALCAGLALGWGLWLERNAVSMRRLYVAARRLDTPESYQLYLKRGGARSEVTEILLPRANLAKAQKRGTVEAILEFKARYEHAKIKVEVDAAWRTALLRELENAKKEGTLTALRGFAQRYPEHELVAVELNAAMDEVFNQAFARFQKTVQQDNLLAFVKRLLNFVRQHGSKIVVRFKPMVQQSLERADAQVKESKYFTGPESLPSQYFDAAHARALQEKTAQALIARWQQALTADILDFELGPPVSKGGDPSPTLPTLLIEHSAGAAGVYLSKKPRGVFVGLGLVFNSSFVIPDAGKPLEFRSSWWRVPDLKLMQGDGASVQDLYTHMAEEGFQRFTSAYLAHYFPKS